MSTIHGSTVQIYTWVSPDGASGHCHVSHEPCGYHQPCWKARNHAEEVLATLKKEQTLGHHATYLARNVGSTSISECWTALVYGAANRALPSNKYRTLNVESVNSAITTDGYVVQLGITLPPRSQHDVQGQDSQTLDGASALIPDTDRAEGNTNVARDVERA